MTEYTGFHAENDFDLSKWPARMRISDGIYDGTLFYTGEKGPLNRRELTLTVTPRDPYLFPGLTIAAGTVSISTHGLITVLQSKDAERLRANLDTAIRSADALDRFIDGIRL